MMDSPKKGLAKPYAEYANPCAHIAHILRIWCGICIGFVERLVVRPWSVSGNAKLKKMQN